VPAAPPSGLAFTACQVQHARATVVLTRHPCQLVAHFLPCARPPDICWPLSYRPRCHPGTHSRQSHRAFVTTRAGFDQDTCIRRAESCGGLLATSFGGLPHFQGAHILYGRPSSPASISSLYSCFLCSMFSHTSSFLGAYILCMHHTSMFCVCPPPTHFPNVFPSCVFLFSLLMCTPLCYLFGGLLVSCYFLSSSRTIGFPLTSLPAASKIGAIDL
jgi:hypothetical protein